MTEAPRPVCWLCSRPIGRRSEQHHPVPKSRGGRTTEEVHPICHRTLHSTFSNSELARIGADRGVIIANPAMARFLVWIADKHPDFHAPTARKKR
ncbi:HNH endonuclease [Novosphingobium sp. B1]|uniref:HNH endonuclease n=1 Tax=Novosphingobium sp. B1 TaxID=1938756 RepID=UPI000A044E63|nr:HNH endonuclease [Novosphingobium sp. B1]